MTITEFKVNMKQALDKADKGDVVLVTRNGKVYRVLRIEGDKA